jgi:hypothetical protein
VAGQMTLLDAKTGLWGLNTSQPIPDSTLPRSVFFRAISAATGLVDSVSTIKGVFVINATAPSQPPVVTITSPTNGSTLNYEQAFTVSANVTSSVRVRSVQLLFNNSLRSHRAPRRASRLRRGRLQAVTIVSPSWLRRILVRQQPPVRSALRCDQRLGTVYDFTGPPGGDWNTQGIGGPPPCLDR